MRTAPCAGAVRPVLVVAGRFGRLCVPAMIGFIAVMTATDIAGHRVDALTIGASSDREPESRTGDQRSFWPFPLLVRAPKGAGPPSPDAPLGRPARR